MSTLVPHIENSEKSNHVDGRLGSQQPKAASDAWDARSIAHDIDTQWGAMPWGGAYKDSNEYWGPGEYDFF